MKAIDQCKTIQDFKDLVALRKNWVDFKDFYDFHKGLKQGERFIMKFTDKAAEMYADYKSKEAVKNYKQNLKQRKS